MRMMRSKKLSKVYPRQVIGRVIACVFFGVCLACTATSPHDHPECSEVVAADWQIPAAWYLRAISPEKAHEQVLTGNLGVDGIRDRWQALHKQFRDGDQYWRYKRPEDLLGSPLGWQEGVVLNRGCLQLGFVTTSMQFDEAAQISRP